jgi:hypothetical protein
MLLDTVTFFTSVLARELTKIPLSRIPASLLKSAQKYGTYEPLPKLGRNRALPISRPVVSSTEMEPLSWRESDKSVRSSRMRGLVFWLDGNWKRKRDVWWDVVISTRIPELKVRAK